MNSKQPLIRAIDVQIAFDHFAIFGGDVDLADFSSFGRVMDPLRPEADLPARTFIAPFEPKLCIRQLQVFQQRILDGCFDRAIRIDLQF